MDSFPVIVDWKKLAISVSQEQTIQNPHSDLQRWLFRLFISHRIKKIYVTEIYMKKQYKSSTTNNHKTKKKKVQVIFRFGARNKKKAL